MRVVAPCTGWWKWRRPVCSSTWTTCRTVWRRRTKSLHIGVLMCFLSLHVVGCNMFCTWILLQKYWHQCKTIEVGFQAMHYVSKLSHCGRDSRKIQLASIWLHSCAIWERNVLKHSILLGYDTGVCIYCIIIYIESFVDTKSKRKSRGGRNLVALSIWVYWFIIQLKSWIS